MPILIGTRGSQLALAQAEGVRVQIADLFPSEEVRLELVKTLGDQMAAPGVAPPQEAPQGIFTKELDEALFSGKIRGAIHSLKDVPTELPAGIEYAAFLKREDPRDALISRTGQKLSELPGGSRIGTSSPRREAQIKACRADLEVLPLRGNVDTRLRKLKEGEVDALVIAAAGLKRLGRQGEVTEFLNPEVMLPAPAQGIVCVTALRKDEAFLGTLKTIDDLEARTCAWAERSFLKTLQGGCRVPVGAFAVMEGKTLTLSGVIADLEAHTIMKNSIKGGIEKPIELGNQLAQQFLKEGAGDILKAFGRSTW